MSVAPEEKFNQEVGEVLQKIRKAELATVGEDVEFKFPSFVGVGIIPKEKQKKILYKLQEWGALRIRENSWEPPESTPHVFYLNLLQPKFNEYYEKFQKDNTSTDLEKRYNQIIKDIRKQGQDSSVTPDLKERDQKTINEIKADTATLSNSQKPSKRELRKQINNIIKVTKIGKKEKALLRLLSKKFDPKTKKEIREETESKAPIKLISTVKEKLKGTKFSVKTHKGSFSRDTTYELEYLPASESS